MLVVIRKILKLMEVLNMGEPEQGMLGREGVKESCATNKAVNGCIGDLIPLASTPFEKQVVIEFVSVEKKLSEELSKIKTELKYVKWMVMALFGAIIIVKLIGG